jgi:hypothetical protein
MMKSISNKDKNIPGLDRPELFFAKIRELRIFPQSLNQNQVNGMNEIIKDCLKAKWPISHVAYALATAYHETARTMQPIKEYGGTAYFTRLYDITGSKPERARAHGNTSAGDGPKYCGRGYVQLTWKNNYKRAEEELNVPLVANPDLALNPDIASDIMILGMSQGWFTGKKNSDYLPTKDKGTKSQFMDARKIINGTDDHEEIAEIALKFQSALEAGIW